MILPGKTYTRLGRLFGLAIPLLIAGSLAVPSLSQPAPKAAATTNLINLPFETYKLPNGLTVILSVDRSIPQAAVDVWYHVGSKNETPGRTGFAHMFEHVMFTGSGHVPYGLHDRLTQGVGGNNNGSTNNDRTNYYENVPSNYIESALWMEADRMGFLLEKLDEAKFVAQRDIVQNERRQGVDNQPYGRGFEIFTAAMYPDSNPYSWPVVGYMSDLQKATVEDVKAFFRVNYAPSNATIAIVGDFDPVAVKEWVKKYFAGLPTGAPVSRPKIAAPVLAEPKRLVFEDRVQVPRLYIAWPAVGEDSDDDTALEMLGQVLAGPRTARLTRGLVYEAQSATNVSARLNANENGGDFVTIFTPRPGHTLSALEASADAILERFKQEGPTEDELARAKAGLEFQFVSGLQSNLGKAETLLNGQVFHGDAGHYKAEYARFKAVTPADVKRVANKYLGKGRVVLSIVPMGKADQASKPEASQKVTVAPDGGHYIMEGR
jgi:zinc protease